MNVEDLVLKDCRCISAYLSLRWSLFEYLGYENKAMFGSNRYLFKSRLTFLTESRMGGGRGRQEVACLADLSATAWRGRAMRPERVVEGKKLKVGCARSEDLLSRDLGEN